MPKSVLNEIPYLQVLPLLLGCQVVPAEGMYKTQNSAHEGISDMNNEKIYIKVCFVCFSNAQNDIFKE